MKLDDLLASERAMERICACLCGSHDDVGKLAEVEAICDRWVFEPGGLIAELESPEVQLPAGELRLNVTSVHWLNYWWTWLKALAVVAAIAACALAIFILVRT